VFLGDITAAFNKNHELESLLFDDFFNKGRDFPWLVQDEIADDWL